MKITSNIGMLLLAIFFILYGLIALLGLHFNGSGVVLAILALGAGIFILIGR